MEQPVASPPEELHPLLIQLLMAHNVPAKTDGPWITFPNHLGRMQGCLFELKHVNPDCSTQLDIRFSPWPGCQICESFAGIGKTREERIRHALESFAQNTMHVLLRVFFDVQCCDQTHQSQIKISGSTRTITDGNLRIYAIGAPKDQNFGLGDQLDRLLETQQLDDRTHWVRLYYAQIDRKPVELELLLDNEPWTSAMPAARLIEFPMSDGFLSLRIFMLIESAFDIGRGVGIMARHLEADNNEMEKLLVAAGIPVIDARKILILAPIAFARNLLQRSGIEVPTVCIVDDGETKSEVDLRLSRIFQQATALAEASFKYGTHRNEFLNIASRDATFKACNQALNNGSKSENLKVSKLIIFWPDSEPLCGQPKGSVSNRDKKPWWKLWS